MNDSINLRQIWIEKSEKVRQIFISNKTLSHRSENEDNFPQTFLKL